MVLYLTIPVADGDSLANAKLHTSATLSGLANGTAYRCYRLSDPSAAFTPVAASGTAIHVFVLGGQSNMVGRASFDGGAVPDQAKVFQYARSGAVSGGVDGAVVPWAHCLDHWDPSAAQMGLDTQFAIDYLAANPSVSKLVFIPGAKGGTGFGTGLWGGGNTLSNDLIARANAYMAATPSAQIKGILWHQGESSLGSASYQSDLDAQLAAFRSAITGASATTPIVVGEIGLFVSAASTSANSIQNIIRNVPNRIAHSACVYTGDLVSTGDNLHFNAAGQRLIGARYCAALAAAAANLSHAATVPGTVDGLTLSVGASGELIATWLAAADHGSAVTGYTLEYRLAGAGSWTSVAVGTGLSRTLSGLSNGSSYEIRVTAANALGSGTPSGVKSATPSSGATVISVAAFSRAQSVLNASSGTWSVTTAGGAVLIAVCGRAVSAAPAVTIGGQAATLIASYAHQTTNMIAWYRASGVASGTVSVTASFSSTVTRAGCAVYSVANANLAGASLAFSAVATASASVAMTSGSALFGVMDGVSATVSWTGLTERSAYTSFGDTFGAEYADYIAATGAESRAVGVTLSGSTYGAAALLVPSL